MTTEQERKAKNRANQAAYRKRHGDKRREYNRLKMREYRKKNL